MFNIPKIDTKGLWENHRGKILAGLAVLLMLLLLGAYSGGRYVQPAKVVEKEHVVTKVETKIEYKDRVVEKKVEVEKKVYVRIRQKNVRREIVDIQKPDGTKERRVTETDLSTTKTADKDDRTTTTDKTEDRRVEEARTEQQDIHKTKVVIFESPQWRVGVLVGYDIMAPFQGSRGVPGMEGVVVGVTGERRIWKRLWMGLWGTTTGNVGLKLDLEL
jgi:hypothetical protein